MFQGKMAINHEELLDVIKNAIKENLKHVPIQAPAAVAGAAPAPADEFGFASSKDEFGF